MQPLERWFNVILFWNITFLSSGFPIHQQRIPVNADFNQRNTRKTGITKGTAPWHIHWTIILTINYAQQK